jgi:tRNA pseudouridine55 synthase
MDGIVSVLKPPGMTSSNVVSDVRKIFSDKHAGHLGTLDPAASGVLPVCLGKATKLFDLLVDKDKEYVFEAAFGTKTDTQDAYGTVTRRDGRRVERDDLARILSELTGHQMQNASAYSALKVGGRKMYELARAGETVETKTRLISVYELELTEQTGENRFLLRTVCSRGTYVRSLCESIAGRLGTVAYVPFLLRTRSGPFSIDRSYTIAELEKAKCEGALAECVVPAEKAVSFLPGLTLMQDRVKPAKNGLKTHMPNTPDGFVRAYGGGEFLGVGEISREQFQLKIHLYG